jgi:hypothetical protein
VEHGLLVIFVVLIVDQFDDLRFEGCELPDLQAQLRAQLLELGKSPRTMSPVAEAGGCLEGAEELKKPLTWLLLLSMVYLMSLYAFLVELNCLPQSLFL